MMSQNSIAPSGVYTSRRMRKGTRSCSDCRKRKVRCIFLKDAKTCELCVTKGRRCVEQNRDVVQEAALETKEILRERIARLEATIQALQSQDSVAGPPEGLLEGLIIAAGTAGNSSALRPLPSPKTSALSSYINSKATQKIDTLGALFDNAIWRRHDSSATAEDDTTEVRIVAKRKRTCEALLSSILPSDLLDIVLSATCPWWHTWAPLGPLGIASIDDERTSTLQDFVIWGLTSSNPSIIGLALLCVAVSLQHLDTRVHQFIIRQLPRLPGDLFQEYFEKVEHLILNDIEYASSDEGIEVTVLLAKIYVNLGHPIKCWLLFHRAISHGQLLGLHSPERLTADETETTRYRRHQAWLSLCSADVYTSLLLGFPYAADGRTIPQTSHNAASKLHHSLISISGKVIDRNQAGLSLSESNTNAIQEELNIAIKDLDTSFWDSPLALANGLINRKEHLAHLTSQCWLHQLTVCLHMPLMIHSVDDTRLEKHRTACLNASRSLLEVYHTMRSDSFAAFSNLKLIDYQAFMGSALLILGLLGYGSTPSRSVKGNKDRDLISLTIATLQQASGTVNNPIASQAVEGLLMLMKLDSGCTEKSEIHCGHNVYAKIVVPNIGTIRVTPGEYLTASRLVFPEPMDGHIPASINTEAYEGQASEYEFSLHTGFDAGHDNMLGPSIDFDWASTIMPAYENDWAWLNDINY